MSFDFYFFEKRRPLFSPNSHLNKKLSKILIPWFPNLIISRIVKISTVTHYFVLLFFGIITLSSCGGDCSGIPTQAFDTSFILVDENGHNAVGPGTGVEPSDVKFITGDQGQIFLKRREVERRNIFDSLSVENYTRYHMPWVNYPNEITREFIHLKIGEKDTMSVQYVFRTERCYGEKLHYIRFDGEKVFDHIFVLD